MLYQLYELNYNAAQPLHFFAQALQAALKNPFFPGGQSDLGRLIGASAEMIERMTRRFGKPEFALPETTIAGETVMVTEEVVLEKPFCQLRHFVRAADRNDPRVLIVAPMSGHHATLLRDTVRTLLQDHKVYITDWVDARMVPAEQGTFGLDDYVAYVQDFIRHIGAERVHVISVCQPTVPVLAAVALMAARGEATPRSLTMMGGPIDPRRSPTSVNNLATTQPLSWFKGNVIHTVPPNYPGRGREVYPGFLQHAGFIAMNPGRHLGSHWDYYQNLLRGDLDDAESHRKFYDEYNAVLDLPAEFYLDTIAAVFQQFLLPRGLWDVRGERVTPAAIRTSALFTVEGELDDISGLGQTQAAHDLCSSIPAKRRAHKVIEGAGHYGIFSGRRWREIVYPQVRDFIRRFDRDASGNG